MFVYRRTPGQIKTEIELEPPETPNMTHEFHPLISRCGSAAVWHSHLRHDFVLTLLHVLPIGFDDGRQELEVLDVAAMRLNAVHKVVNHAVADVVAKLVVVHEDVTHGLSFQQLEGATKEVVFVNITQKRSKELVWD